MNWKRFKNLFRDEKLDESRFILGIDLGNDSTALAYFDAQNNSPEIIDISGGYGKPSIPTVIQYISETKEWVYGEYALLNRGLGQEITLSFLIEKLGKKEYVEIDKKPMSIVNVLGLYLKEVIGSVRNLNPKAEIAGIIVAIPSYLSEEAKEELLWAFKNAGYEKEVISLVNDRECIFASYYFNQKPAAEKILLLDFGSRELRGSVYDADPEDGVVSMKSVSSLFESELGTKCINDRVANMFTQYYCDETGIYPHKLTKQIKDQISSFVYQHKDLLFQKNITQKPLKIYFNFAYPPFQKTFTRSLVEELTAPYREKFIFFINNILEKNIYTNEKIYSGEINTVLCTGGGFEMLWARSIIADFFPNSQIKFYKNSKGITAEGAAITAAERLDVLESAAIRIEDRHQVNIDIGINVKSGQRERFVPVIEKNSFWWQRNKPKLFILNDNASGTVSVDILMRDANGELGVLGKMTLDGLPERPKGTTRLCLDMQFVNFSEISAVISDKGFGDIYPQTDYERKYIVNL